MTTAAQRSKQRLQLRHQLKKENPKGTSLTSKVTQKIKSKNALESVIGKQEKKKEKKKTGVTTKEASKASLLARHIAKALKNRDIEKAQNYMKGASKQVKRLIDKKLVKLRKKSEKADDLNYARLLDNAIKWKGETLEELKNVKNTNDKIAQKIVGNIRPGSDYKAQQYFNYFGLKFADQEGAFQIPGSKFAGWNNQIDGIKAGYNQVRKDQNRHLSITNFVEKYAPRNENDTDTYIKQLAETLGVSANTDIATLNEDNLVQFLGKKESQTEIPISDYGGGGGVVALGKMLDNYEVPSGGYDNVNQSSGYSDVVAYKSGGQYYSVNTYTGEKVKVSKADAKSLEQINDKQYKEIKNSLTTMAKTSSGGKSNALNRDQLAALKAVRPDLAGKNSKQLLNWWKTHGSDDSSLITQVNSYVTKTGGTVGSNASYDLENDPNYQALPDDLKKAAAYFENVGLASNTEQGTKLINALQTAASQSDAYMKQFYNIAADSLIRTSEQYQSIFGTESERLNKRITEINEDLAKNKEFLTLEEQSDLTRISNEYKANLQSTQGTMAAAGLTQSTIRSEAEKRLSEQQTGLVEDTQRQYGKKITELETSAQRGNKEAQTQLDELKRNLGYNITNLGREAEQYLGSSNMPAISGYSPLGGLSGTYNEDKLKDIALRAGTLLGESNMESLNLNL